MSAGKELLAEILEGISCKFIQLMWASYMLHACHRQLAPISMMVDGVGAGLCWTKTQQIRLSRLHPPYIP